MKEAYSFAFQLTRPLRPQSDHICFQDRLISDIESWGGQLPFISEYFVPGSKLLISIYKNPTEYAPFKKEFKARPARQYYLMVFRIEGEICESKIGELINSLPCDEEHRDELIEYYKHHIPLTSVILELHNFFLIANIAFPGALTVSNGISFISNNKFNKIEDFYAEDLYLAIQTAEKLKWPKLQQISILEAWDWLKNSNSLIDGIGKNSLGRALAAFSRITKESPSDDSTLDIIWALLGLEALYAKGNVGLKEQLVAKTEILLGKKEENKKAFGNMYDFRSRLVHGDIDIPLSHSPYNASPEYENFHQDLGQSGEIAIATLIATFQIMIKNNWNELEFNYTVSGK